MKPTQHKELFSASTEPVDSSFTELLAMTQLFLPFAIRGLATLGVADVIAKEPLPVEKIAQAVNAEPDALYRTLRYTASRGVFEERPGRVFALTPIARYLCSETPNSARSILMIDDAFTSRLRVLCEVVHTLRTGESAYRKVTGHGPFDTTTPGRPASRHTVVMMRTERNADAVLDAVDFTADHMVVDVGGGTGTMLGTILARQPHLRGVLFDLPSTVAQAPAVLDELEVTDRCTTVGGDMFKGVPSGADAYLLSNVLTDWSDDKALSVLDNIRTVAPKHSRLLISEQLVDGAKGRVAQRLQLDFNLMLTTSGRKRTAAEYEKLLDQAGFTATSIDTSDPEVAVIEARPQ